MIKNTHKLSEGEYLRWKLVNEPGDVVPYLFRTARFLAKRGGEKNRHTNQSGKIKLAHFGLHCTGDNAGDMALFAATADIVSHFIKNSTWTLKKLREELSNEVVDELNRTAHGAIIGGGGLFLADVTDGSKSGWQWNCSAQAIERLEVPFAIFAVGFNKFRDQDDFPAVFRENLECVVRKSAFFGLRNFGSIRSIKGYLPAELHDRVQFQPCPTTVLRYYWPTLSPTVRTKRDKVMAMNFVTDRVLMRFKNKTEDVFNGFAKIAKQANDRGWEVILTTHARSDAVIIPTLKKFGVKFRVEHLERKFVHEIVDFYKDIPLTVGMRGHAQMIPFGCGNGIISLVSHDKMTFFLDSVNKPHWGVEVLEPNFVERTLALVDNFDKNRAAIHQEIDEAQAKLWQHTTANLAVINKAVLARAQSMGVKLNGAVAA